VHHRGVTPTGHRTWLALLLPLALAAVAYARVLHGEFVFDDLLTGPASPAAQDLSAAAAGAWRSFWSGGRPVTDLTFALNRRLGGPDPWGYHLVNVGLHLATAVLLWRLASVVLERAGAARAGWQAVVVAGLWVVHPLGSQAVSYVTQRSEVLASGLMAAALLAFLRAEREGRTARGGAALGLGLVALWLALGSKATAVTTPALWVLVAWAAPVQPATRSVTGWRIRAAALLAPAGLALAHSLGVLRSLAPAGNAGFELSGLDPWSYFLTQLRVVVTYARLVLWPAGQSVDWNLAPSRSLLEPAVLASGTLLMALAGGAVALVLLGRRRADADGAAARVAGLGVLWFLVALAPTSSVVPVADLLVEHRAYLASWGLVLALVAAGERMAARVRWRHAGLAAGAATLAAWLVLAGALHARNAVWESALALWSDATAGGRGTARAYVGMGVARAALGDLQGAVDAYGEAYRRSRGRPLDEAHALHNTGVVLTQAGDLETAERVLRGAVERAPKGAEMAYALAYVLWRRGDGRGAERSVERALALQPGHGPATHLLGLLRLEAGQVEAATALLQEAARLAPGNGAVHADLGMALHRAGRAAEACAAWRAALRLPTDPEQRQQTLQWMAAAGCPPG
jgi:tetratricopeptide (TPR) repeat protein